MRKILCIILASLLIVGTVFALTPGNRKNPGIGNIPKGGVYDSDPHRTFRLVRYVPVGMVERNVKNTSTAALDAGTDATESNLLTADSIVVWSITYDDGVTICEAEYTADSAVAGIIVQDALTPNAGTEGNSAFDDIGNQNWTWLQTYGLSEVDMGVGYSATAKQVLSTCDFRNPGLARAHASRDVLAPQGAGTNKRLSDDSKMLGHAGFFTDVAGQGEEAVSVFLRCE